MVLGTGGRAVAGGGGARSGTLPNLERLRLDGGAGNGPDGGGPGEAVRIEVADPRLGVGSSKLPKLLLLLLLRLRSRSAWRWCSTVPGSVEDVLGDNPKVPPPNGVRNEPLPPNEEVEIVSGELDDSAALAGL